MALRPLNGIDELSLKPADAQVLMVPGRTAETIARNALNGASIAVLSWEGMADESDFSPLAGRKIAVLPPVGAERAMRSAIPAVNAARRVSDVVRVVDISDQPLTWTLDDENWDKPKLLAFLRDRVVPLPEVDRSEDEAPEVEYGEQVPEELPEAVEAQPFRALGHDHATYYYHASRTKQVVELTAQGHSGNNLFMLAEPGWWARQFPTKSGTDWSGAAGYCMNACHNAGIFDPSRLRGRGAWWDEGRAIEHVGDRLYVDGVAFAIETVRSRWIYEQGAPMSLPDGEALTPQQASALIRVCEMLPWERPVNGKLLAGWVVCALVCGALQWRPHIWCTGPRGCGKSWVLSEIVAPCLGDHCLQVESSTSEAGIRGALGYDALPVLFDEAEGEDQRAQERVQNVMQLMRAASSSNGGRIIKGTAQGGAKSYQIRSCFAFASISVGLKQQSDISRVSVLSLVNRHAQPSEFAKLREAVTSMLSGGFAHGLYARVVKGIPALRRNAALFARAAAEKFGDQRTGDQIGALLAGAWMLARDADVTVDQARRYISEQDWSEERSQSEVKDEVGCLSHIMEHMVRTDDGDRTIGELIAIVRDGNPERHGPADSVLRRYGIKAESKAVFISNSHSGLRKILEKTPWAQHWGRMLGRLEGAEKAEPMRFGDGSPSARATVLPARYFE